MVASDSVVLESLRKFKFRLIKNVALLCWIKNHWVINEGLPLLPQPPFNVVHEVKNEVTKIIQRFQVTPQIILALYCPATTRYQLRRARFHFSFVFNFYSKGSTSTATKTTQKGLKSFGRVEIENRSRMREKNEPWFLFVLDFTS